MKMQKRIAWVDIAKYIGIYFVMISHLECNTNILFVCYGPFFLNVFYFSAGYVYDNGQKFHDFLYRKIRQLLIPWFVFSNFNIISRNMLSFNIHVDMWTELKDNMLQAWGDGQELWFIVALFVAFIPFYFVVKLLERIQKNFSKFYIVSIIIWLIVVYFYGKLIELLDYPWNRIWHVDTVASICFFMLVGYVYAHYIESKISIFHLKEKYWFAVGTLVIYIFVIYISSSRFVELSELWLYNVLESVLGVFAVVQVSKVINCNRFMEYCGQNTLIYYALHGKVYSIIQTILKKIIPSLYTEILAVQYKAIILSVVVAYIMSCVLIIPCMIINRYFPYILGRKID